MEGRLDDYVGEKTVREERGESERVVLSNIRGASLKYSGNEGEIREHNSAEEVTGILQNCLVFFFFWHLQTFVPLGTQGVLLSLTHFAFWFRYWISPATLFSLDHACFSFLDQFCSLWVYGFRPDLTHEQKPASGFQYRQF